MTMQGADQSTYLEQHRTIQELVLEIHAVVDARLAYVSDSHGDGADHDV